MNDQTCPLELKIYFFSRQFLQKLVTFVTACFTGFWLGVLSKETLHSADQYYYNNTQMYCDEAYNKRGLWDWEKRVINEYFQPCKTLLLIGAGGGRETFALNQLGYEVDGFECNTQLVDFANNLFEKEAVNLKLQVLNRDCCPITSKIYDGLIIGWGTYMLIQGRENRVAFLQKLRDQLKEGAPVLLSFYHHPKNRSYFKVVAIVGNFFRKLLFRSSLELGDDLAPEFVHYFNKGEITSELDEGGFRLEIYRTNEYGHAVGTAN